MLSYPFYATRKNLCSVLHQISLVLLNEIPDSLSVCLIKWEYAGTCFGLTGTALQSLCEASLMAAMPSLLSTQLWGGLMDLLWTTCKMLVIL